MIRQVQMSTFDWSRMLTVSVWCYLKAHTLVPSAVPFIAQSMHKDTSTWSGNKYKWYKIKCYNGWTQMDSSLLVQKPTYVTWTASSIKYPCCQTTVGSMVAGAPRQWLASAMLCCSMTKSFPSSWLNSSWYQVLIHCCETYPIHLPGRTRHGCKKVWVHLDSRMDSSLLAGPTYICDLNGK